MYTPTVNPDALIIGSGPAGLALAAALAARGVSTSVLAPDPRARWEPTYGVWASHLPQWAEAAVETRFERSTVDFGSVRQVLERPYARLDTPRLQALMLERCVAAGVTLVSDRAERVEHSPEGSVVHGGAAHRSRLVVDASGASALVPSVAPTLFQTAYGVLADVEGSLDELVWMDFSFPHGDGSEPATFLYAMPAADGRVFLEETSLARMGGLPFPELERRLHERLRAMGLSIRRVHHVERCVIGLDRRTERGGQTLAFGAAAGMVHPATGYLVGRVLAQSEVLAQAIAEALPSGPLAAARAGWQTLWPADRRRRFGLYRYGAHAVAGFGAADTRRFFASFFEHARWGPWLDDELSLVELMSEMTRLFVRLPVTTQARLLQSSFTGTRRSRSEPAPHDPAPPLI
jgi:lycopene cyclase-like protein